MALLLQARGPTTARDLAQALDVSQPTISRMVAALGPAIERIGAGRSARYALRRELPNHGGRWPVLRIDPAGKADLEWANLVALHGGFRLLFSHGAPDWLERAYPDGLFPGLPFFLSDLRPEGFLGRLVARQVAETIGAPADPRLWNDDHVVAYLVQFGEDLGGDLVVGEAAWELASQRMLTPAYNGGRFRTRGLGEVVAANERTLRYAELAGRVMRGETWGSSAGGEQPKFVTCVEDAESHWRPVLVKFSPPQDTPAGVRWADLLVAEAIALDVLREHDVAATRAEIFDAGGRCFLEMTRFDREGQFGRRGVLTLSAVEAGLIEHQVTDWAVAANALETQGLLTPGGAADLRRRWCFGRLIGNTDMHFGNVSLWWRDAAPLELAPAYDMLPMLFAPSAQGEVVSHDFAPPPPTPAAMSEWLQAASWARGYWQRVAEDSRITAVFREIAGNALRAVTAATDRFA